MVLAPCGRTSTQLFGGFNEDEGNWDSNATELGLAAESTVLDRLVSLVDPMVDDEDGLAMEEKGGTLQLSFLLFDNDVAGDDSSLSRSFFRIFGVCSISFTDMLLSSIENM